MITFLKGDTTAAITLALADGFDYSGKTVHLEYQGVRRTFTGCTAGGTLDFSFAAEETAPMSLGTYPVRAWIEGDGEVVTVHNADVKLRVTDCIADVHGGGAIYLDVHGGLHGIEGLPERYTDDDLRRKINEILRRGGGTVAALLLCATAAFGASVEVQTAPKGTIYNDQPVVTNVTVDVSDKADKTNTYSKAETDAKIVELAPAPGNYGVVSNAAMHAVQNKQSRIRIENNPRISWDAYDVQYLHLATDRRGWEFVYDDFGSLFLPIKFGDHTAATMSDLAAAAEAATNYTDEAIANIDIPHPDLSEYAKLYTVEAVSNKVEETSAIVNTWETYWGGDGVKMEVTNYYGNTTGALPRLRIRERRDGVWTNVWDEVDKFEVCKAEILGDVATSNRAVLAVAETNFAPIAWGTVTDKGTANHATNAVWMTSPETYFAGGTEYQRVAVGSGAICVLVDKGALAHTAGEPGTFRFQDDGGTNYFGFSKSDSYTIGCRTDGITVGTGNLVTLRYDVIMSGTDVPVVYWAQSLGQTTQWTQLNNVDGTAASGAPYTVTWLQDGGSYYANINCGGSPSGFFRAETSVAGDVVWETNMRARLGGGIECTNTTTHVNGVIRPSYNGSSVTWTWSAR